MNSSLMLQLDVVCTNIFNAIILQEFSVMQVSVSLVLLRPAVRASSRPFLRRTYIYKKYSFEHLQNTFFLRESRDHVMEFVDLIISILI